MTYLDPTTLDTTIVTETSTDTLTNKTLTSPVLTTPQINDTSADHQYVFAVNELSADRTVTLPLLTGNDEFVFKDHTQTLTNKTIGGVIDTNLVDKSTTETITGQWTFNEDIVMQAANGIDFTGNAGAAGETSAVLDWYEEGTFTPTLQDGSFSDSESQTYSVQQGNYTRIGDRVFFNLKITVTSIGGLSGATYINGLPFTSKSTSNSDSSISIYGTGLSISSGVAATAKIAPSNPYISLWLWDDTSGTTPLLASEVSTGTLILSGSYLV